jgi:hypothetical protein
MKSIWLSVWIVLALPFVLRATDLSFAPEKAGGFVGLRGHLDQDAFDGEFGVFLYPKAWLAINAAARGFNTDKMAEAYGGGALSVEVVLPGRISPFVGVGGFIGWVVPGLGINPSDRNGMDDNGNGLIDETGEKKPHEDDAKLISIHPRIGLHLWLTEKWRVSLDGQYEITSLGRRKDAWFYGARLGMVLPWPSHNDL